MNVRTFLAKCLSLLLVCAPATILAAQTEPSTSHDADAPLIRVYTHLLQIPVLILDPFLDPVKPIDPSKFTIQFDDGKPFRPKLVRLQGEDPITLAILVDRSRKNTLLPGLADALATLTPGLLGARDRVVVYATDGCHLRRHGQFLPVQRALLRTFAESAAAGGAYDRSAAGPCATNMSLWKSAAAVAQTLVGEPGRRVVLAITDGVDADHDYSADQARAVAISSGTAIFAVAERGKVPPGPTTGTLMSMANSGGRGGRSVPPMPSAAATTDPSDLANLSERSGGMLLETDVRGLPNTLRHFVALVRGRYIVEFVRPEHLAAVDHTLTVSIGQPRYLIRAAGTTMRVADPTELDPSVERGQLSGRPPDPDQLAPAPPPTTDAAK